MATETIGLWPHTPIMWYCALLLVLFRLALVALRFRLLRFHALPKGAQKRFHERERRFRFKYREVTEREWASAGGDEGAA